MNDLNSILLEGVAHHIKNWEHDTPLTYFELTTRKGENTATIVISAEGNLAQVCHTYLQESDHIRVIGRIAQLKNSHEIYILAEHIEIKPPKSQEGESS